MDRWLKENLVCPRDHNKLQLKDDILVCPLGHTYPYIYGIPIMLLKEVKPTHGDCCRTLKQTVTSQTLHQLEDEITIGRDAVDPYVQRVIAETCGIAYQPLIGKLTRYPIPELCLPQASAQQYFLDIGCNWGRWCISAVKKGYSPVGIDPSFDAVRAACRIAQQLKVSAIYLVADARYLPFKTDCFDTIFSYSVLQHFDKEDVILCLSEIARTLKVSGTCLIQMPNIFGLRNLYNQFRRGFKEPTSFEVRYWTLSELKNTFSNFIGPTSLFVDGYFSLNTQKRDVDLLPLRYRLGVYSSEILRRLSEKMQWMKYFADSIYVKSIRKSG